MKVKAILVAMLMMLISPPLAAQVCSSTSLAASVACAKFRRTTIDPLDLQTAGVVSTMHQAFPTVATYPYFAAFSPIYLASTPYVAISFQPLAPAFSPYIGAAITSSWYGGWYGWRVGY